MNVRPMRGARTISKAPSAPCVVPKNPYSDDMVKLLVATPLYPPDSGGPATHAALMAEKLPAHDFEVTVVSFGAFRQYPMGVRHALFAWALFMAAIKADVLFAEDTLSVGWPLAFVGMFIWKPLFVRVPGDQVWEKGRQRFGVAVHLESFPQWSWQWHPWMMWMRLLQWVVLWRARTVIVPSGYLEDIVSHWRFTKGKIVRVYNGIEFPIVFNEAMRITEGPHIVTVARLVPWKGIRELIDVVFTEPTWQLTIVGDGPEMASLVAHVASQRESERIHFAGQLVHPDALGVIKTADVFVLNSRYEGLSHTLLEAMGLGVPVVATDIPGNREVVDDDENGRLVPVGDHEVLRAAIAATIGHPTYGERAREKARQFEHNTTLEHLAAILRV